MAFAVRDDMQNRGIGTELLSYLILLAKREGLLGFTAEVLAENRPMLHVFEKMFPDLEKSLRRECTNWCCDSATRISEVKNAPLLLPGTP